MTPENEIKPAAPAEGLDGGRCAVDAGFGSLRVCATKIEIRGTKDWTHCPERVVCSFVDRGEFVPLCERCARNVRNGAYGARLRDLLNEQVPNHILGDTHENLPNETIRKP